MSAFRTSQLHQAIVVQAIRNHTDYLGTDEELFKEIDTENQRSLEARYGEARTPCPEYAAAPPSELKEQYSLLASYNYQSCEHVGWELSKVRRYTTAAMEEIRDKMGWLSHEQAMKNTDDEAWSV